MPARTLDDFSARGKRVLLRADLNVPVQNGKISDLTRLERLSPTIKELSEKGAKVIVCSHFDRPKGKRVPEFSLRPIAAALAEVLGRPVAFAEDCVGEPAEKAVRRCATAMCWCWKTPAIMPAKRPMNQGWPRTWRRWRRFT